MKLKVLGGKNLADGSIRFDQIRRLPRKLRGSVDLPRGVFRFADPPPFCTEIAQIVNYPHFLFSSVTSM